MFFNAHIFFTDQRSGGEADAWRAMGAVLPDSLFTGTIGWQDLHHEKAGRAFAKSLGDKTRAAQLEAGILDHIALDEISHHTFNEQAEGYSFSHQTPELVALVSKACRTDKADVARGLAHNFIESAVDIHLLADQPHLQERVHRAVTSVDLDWLAAAMAAHWEKDPAETRRKLQEFKGLVTKYDLAQVGGWTDCWMEITRRQLHHDGDPAAARQALELAVGLTAHDYQRVLT